MCVCVYADSEDSCGVYVDCGYGVCVYADSENSVVVYT